MANPTKRKKVLPVPYYLHSAVKNAFVVIGAHSPYLIEYGSNPNILPARFMTEQEAMAFRGYWTQTPETGAYLREARLLIVHFSEYPEKHKVGARRRLWKLERKRKFIGEDVPDLDNKEPY